MFNDKVVFNNDVFGNRLFFSQLDTQLLGTKHALYFQFQ